VTAEIATILARVPAIPAAASLQAPLPAPLTLDGRPPAGEQRDHQTRVAAIGTEHARIAAASPELKRT
jgi:hypothetical protein